MEAIRIIDHPIDQITTLQGKQTALRQELKVSTDSDVIKEIRSEIMRNRLGSRGLRALNNQLRNCRI